MFEQLSDRLRGTVKRVRGQARITEQNIKDAMREVRIALLEADVALPVVKEFITHIQERAVGKDVIGSLTPGQAVIKIVQEELVALMGQTSAGLELKTRPPATILVAGLQGAGKTTTVVKLASWISRTQKKRVLVASADVYRPAAVDQLKKTSRGRDYGLFLHDGVLTLRYLSRGPGRRRELRFRCPDPGYGRPAACR